MINRTRYESNDLDKNQNEAARIVSGATKLASILSFQKRVGLCPDDLTSIVPATVCNTSASSFSLFFRFTNIT